MNTKIYFKNLFTRYKFPLLAQAIGIIFILTGFSSAYATTYYARSNKDWNDTQAWSLTSRNGSSAGSIPGAGDHVIIDGRKIDIDAANVTIASLTVTNAGNSDAYLRMQNGRKLTVTGNMTVTAENKNKNINIYLEDNGSEIEVQGDLTFTRAANNSKEKRNRLFMENNTDFTVMGDFKIDHKNSSSSLDENDIELDDNATFTCESDVYLNMSAGGDLNVELKSSSSWQIDGDVISTTSGGGNLEIKTKDNATLTVNGNFTHTQTGGEDFDLRAENGNTGSEQIHFLGNFLLDHNAGDDVSFLAKNKGEIAIDGNFTIDWDGSSSSEKDFDLSIEDYGVFDVDGSFSISMNDPNDGVLSIDLKDHAALQTGDLLSHSSSLTMLDGDYFRVSMKDNAVWSNAGDLSWNYTDGSSTSSTSLDNNAIINVGKDLIITNDQNVKEFSVNVNNSSVLNVDGDIDISSAAAANRIDIKLEDNSKLELGGDIIRASVPYNYGEISSSSSATVEFNGAQQQVFPQEDGASSDDIYLTKVIINNTYGSTPQITMEGDATVHKSITFTDGVISSSTAAILKLADNGTVSGASSTSYVDGPFAKIGNNSFTFPIGSDGYYSPITMSAPSSNSDEFNAQYVHASAQSAGYDSTLTVSGIDHISNTEYWVLNRISGSSNVKATLGWNASRSGDIGSGTVCDIRLTRWDGTKWKNEGNGGTSGNASNGTIITGTSENCSTSSYITSWVYGAPITLAVDSNYITWNGTVFEGGSDGSGAPSTADAGRALKVFGVGAITTIDAELSKIIVTPTGDLTIASGVTITVNGIVKNDGVITIENNGSLIQTSAGADDNAGTGTYYVERTGNTSDASYNIWSSPVQNADIISVFTGANPCDMWVFDGFNQVWSHDFTAGYSANCYGNAVTFTVTDVITGGDGIMDAARGYYVPGAVNSTKQFTGNVNNGDITVSVNNTVLGNQPFWNDDDWNLIGNPYPSALNAAAFWTENAINNSRITDALYFWDDNGTGTGYNQNADYASWNALGGVNSGNSTVIPNGSIASGQGFWVVANQNTNVQINNSMRSGTNDQFFKKDPDTDKHLSWISVTTPSGYNNNILVGYAGTTTDTVDALYDAHKLTGNAHVRFASLIGTEEFSIQGFSSLYLGDEKVIPLVLFTDETGNHTFTEYKRENLPSNIKVFIRDLRMGTTHDLSTGSYTVSLNGNNTYNSRFELIFKKTIEISNNQQTVKGLPIDSTNTNGVSMIGSAPNEFSLATNADGFTLSNPNGIYGDIYIYDITGKKVLTKTNVSSNQYIITKNELSSGVYFLQVHQGSTSVFQEKIINP